MQSGMVFIVLSMHGVAERLLLLNWERMELSIRTLARMNEWVRLIRQLPEGLNELPERIDYDTYRSLFNTCSRESQGDTPFKYKASFKKERVTIIKSRKDAESSQPRLSAEWEIRQIASSRDVRSIKADHHGIWEERFKVHSGQALFLSQIQGYRHHQVLQFTSSSIVWNQRYLRPSSRSWA